MLNLPNASALCAAQHKPVGEATLDTRMERLEQSLKAQLQQEREERQHERQQLLAEINKLQDGKGIAHKLVRVCVCGVCVQSSQLPLT